MEPIPLTDWQRVCNDLARCFDAAGTVTADDGAFHFQSHTDRVQTTFSLQRDGRLGASMPLHGLELVATHILIDLDQRSVTALGPSLRYTYRLPPSLLDS